MLACSTGPLGSAVSTGARARDSEAVDASTSWGASSKAGGTDGTDDDPVSLSVPTVNGSAAGCTDTGSSTIGDGPTAISASTGVSSMVASVERGDDESKGREDGTCWVVISSDANAEVA
ncbi:hypothetical protein BS47DRAFT_1055920 [Hydnum rufescens UP504]|uniref:Uncharacterized protein n=1 Tax=Hydnum rufescens UP504 TaxID=1448309 RepID=A0A9P6DRT9_9AGAM|nr:hypothetical protein BS47DRAFT_1055920 [Hydnum rufescens UP504]